MTVTDNTQICNLILGGKAPSKELLCCQQGNCVTKNQFVACSADITSTLA